MESRGGILVLHPSEVDLNRKWHIPGGLRDDINEPLIDTGRREVFEETGINLAGYEARTIMHGEWTAVDHGIKIGIVAVFLHVVLLDRPKVILSHEHDDYAWLTPNNHTTYDANLEVHKLVIQLLTS